MDFGRVIAILGRQNHLDAELQFPDRATGAEGRGRLQGKRELTLGSSVSLDAMILGFLQVLPGISSTLQLSCRSTDTATTPLAEVDSQFGTISKVVVGMVLLRR